MISSLLVKTTARTVARRNFSTTLSKKSADPLFGHIEQTGRPGSNLPFGINNKYKLALYIALFFGSGLAVPFIAVRFQLLKKNSS